MTEFRTSYHESAHAVVAFRLAQPIKVVSVRPGATYAGIMMSGVPSIRSTAGFDAFVPAIAQPARVRDNVEGRIGVSLAGQMGADLLWRESGYAPTPPDEVAAKAMALEFTGLSPQDAEYLAALEVDPTPMPHDEEAAAMAAWALAGNEANGLFFYLRAATRSIVEANSDHIAALAEALARANGDVRPPGQAVLGREEREAMALTRKKMFKVDRNELYVAWQSAACDVAGTPYVIPLGTRLRGSHPAVQPLALARSFPTARPRTNCPTRSTRRPQRWTRSWQPRRSQRRRRELRGSTPRHRSPLSWSSRWP